MPILRGRDFTFDEVFGDAARRVAIIDEPLARRLFPGSDPLGRSIEVGGSEPVVMAGLYGMKAFLISRRTRQIGVRMALGAKRAAVATQMMRESMSLTLVGIVVGLVSRSGSAKSSRAFSTRSARRIRGRCSARLRSSP